MLQELLALFARLVVAQETIAGKSTAPTAPPASNPATGDKPQTAAEKKKADKAAADAAAAAAKTFPTEEETNAALTKLKEFVDSDKGEGEGIKAARAVMAATAGVKKMAEIPEDKRAAVIAGAEVALAEAEAAAGDGM